jgi:regulator of sirC expression with transglutaminase-like and TPR domain
LWAKTIADCGGGGIGVQFAFRGVMGVCCSVLPSITYHQITLAMSSFANDPQFRRLLSDRTDVDLPQLMLELAADAYPRLDRSACLMELDRLGADCRRRLQAMPRASTRQRLQEISRQLYEVEGFRGNATDYYDPDNSYLNRVLERRTGIPISLGIVYLTVAARAGIAMHGTQTPGHFMIGCAEGDEPLFVDPFNGGRIIREEDIAPHLQSMMGKELVLADNCLRPAGVQYIMLRVLQNLKHVLTEREAWSALLKVQRRLTAMFPIVPEERRDHGLVALRAGQPREAYTSLELYAKLCGGELDAETQNSLKLARRMVAEMN